MWVLEVLPLTTLPPQTPQILSYYHDSDLPKGAVVEVPLNNRLVAATVIDSYDLDQQKLLVKKSLFQFKKTNKVLESKSVISEWQFKIALWLAGRYIAPLGLCLKNILPPFFLKPHYPVEPTQLFITATPPITPQWIITRAQESAEKIFPLIKSVGSSQTLIVVPDQSYLPYFEGEFKKFKPELLTSASGLKEYYRIWKNISSNKTSLVIGTRQALFLPFANLKNLIVIDPLHEFYKSDMSPKYWTPELAEFIASSHGAQYVACSPMLNVETYEKSKQEKVIVVDKSKPWPAKVSVIDLTYEYKQGYIVGSLTPDARDILRETLAKKEKVLIVSARRGYSGILICQKCSYSFKCPNCDLPMRIHQGLGLSLLCHHCNHSQPYPNSCPNCHSSQIKQTGPAGGQKIFEELQKMIAFGQLDKTEILLMDADVTKNQTEEDEVVNEIKKATTSKKPLIIIATQKIFSYSYELEFDTVIIPQLDALAVGSDFQTTERLWYHLEKLADFMPSRIAAQTFNQIQLLPNLSHHDYTPLYETELSARKAFWYPPYCRIIKLTYSHKDHKKVVVSARTVIEKLKMASIHIKAQDKIRITDTSKLFLKKERGIFTYSIIIKTSLDFHPRDLLRYVPTQWMIDVDPRTTT